MARPAMRRGAYRILAAARSYLAFSRIHPDETLFLAVNCGEAPVSGLRFDLRVLHRLPESRTDLLDESHRVAAEAILLLDLPPKRGKVVT